MTLVTGEMKQTLQRIYSCASWCKVLPVEIKNYRCDSLSYCMVLARILWYCVLFHGIAMVLYAITMVLYGFDLH